MESLGLDSFRVPGVGTFFIQRKNHPNIVDKEGFIQWLDENGMATVAPRTVHPMTLVGIVNDWLKDGKQLPPSLNNFVEVKVQYRKTTNRKESNNGTEE